VSIDVIGPEATCSAGLGISRHERGPRLQVFEVLHDNGGFVGRPCWAVADCGDEATWVDVEEGLGLLVGVYLDVLVGNSFVLEGDPDALDEGAKGGRVNVTSCCVKDVHLMAREGALLNLPETAAEQFEFVFFGVAFDGGESRPGGLFVVCLLLRIAALVGVGHCEADGVGRKRGL